MKTKMTEPTKEGFYDDDGLWNSVRVINGRFYRERAEVIIINGDAIMIRTHIDGHYRFPGGSTEPALTLMETAIKECEEEIHITPKNLQYYGYYIEDNDQIRDKYNYPYVGYCTHIFVGEFGEEYTGNVDALDENPEMLQNCKWQCLGKVMKRLRPEHKDAIRNYIM